MPLPNDGLRAVNVYAIEADEGLTLVDGGWAIAEGRNALESGLQQLGFGFGDVRRFLVTHAHRDHYTLASTLGREYEIPLVAGIGERPTLDAIHGAGDRTTVELQLRLAGADQLARSWAEVDRPDPALDEWHYPQTWLDGDVTITVGTRELDAVHTPGHTQGHYVFADRAQRLLFAGDHVLPTITPSIGFEARPAASALGDFMASLTKVRSLTDLHVLPAHGPVAPSSHDRIDQLLAHHEDRLALCMAAIDGGARSALAVARLLPWTRQERSFGELDLLNSVLATLETKAHLELLAARGRVTRAQAETLLVFAPIVPAGTGGRADRAL